MTRESSLVGDEAGAEATHMDVKNVPLRGSRAKE